MKARRPCAGYPRLLNSNESKQWLEHALSLSETKSAHIGDATRPGLTVAECGRRSLRSGLPANPYSMRGACEFDCSSVRKIEADAEDAARQIRQHGQGSRAESSRSAFHNIHSAMAIAARLVDPECPSPEGVE
jgi:hypothetical protein